MRGKFAREESAETKKKRGEKRKTQKMKITKTRKKEGKKRDSSRGHLRRRDVLLCVVGERRDPVDGHEGLLLGT